MHLQTILGSLVVVACLVALARRKEPRLCLLLAGAALATIAGTPLAAFDAFVRAMVAPMVAPICASMGFAAVLAATGCDRALVHALAAPLRRMPSLALPGAVVAAFVVNLAAPSQSGTAAMVGPVLVPLLCACGFPATVAAAAVLLGASFGADLLNPGAQDIQSIAGACAADPVRVHAVLVRALPLGIAAAAISFALLHGRRDAAANERARFAEPLRDDGTNAARSPMRTVAMACTPLAPIVAVLLAHAQAPGFAWLLAVPEGDAWRPFAAALPIVRAMLLGSVLAAVVGRANAKTAATSFFAGMGRAYADVISLTIAAQVFGAGVATCGLGAIAFAALDGDGARCAASIASPWLLATLSGSGSGPILAHAQTLLAPMPAGPALDQCAAFACLGGAFGRTTSPVSAVAVVAASFAATSPIDLLRKLALPLAVGAAVAIASVAIEGA